MPANPKYLSNSKQRWAKVLLAILGGYIFTSLLHVGIGTLLVDKKYLVGTSIYSSFLVWTAFMIFAFMAKSIQLVIWSLLGSILAIIPIILYFK